MPAKTLPIAGGHPTGAAATSRTDGWWVGPLLTVLGLGGFILYSTWAAFQAEHYYYMGYLSPFYSPVVFTNVGAGAAGAAPVATSLFGNFPEWWPKGPLPMSPAFLILMFPGAFRFTCYYYRKAYYRSFVGSPPGCAVAPVTTRKYSGESKLMLFQNLHRFALYFALIFVVILFHDAYLAFFRDGKFGVGVGSIVLLMNATLLTSYTFGCHSFRHLIGGGKDCMSHCGKPTVTLSSWKIVSWFNSKHMAFAWISLFWVGFSDFYVRMVSMGHITDISTWN